MRITPKDIQAYRITYRPQDWEEFAKRQGTPFCVILGAVDAIRALCDEVERLWKIRRKGRRKEHPPLGDKEER